MHCFEEDPASPQFNFQEHLQFIKLDSNAWGLCYVAIPLHVKLQVCVGFMTTLTCLPQLDAATHSLVSWLST